MAGGEIFPLPFFVTVWIRTFEKKVQQPFERSEKNMIKIEDIKQTYEGRQSVWYVYVLGLTGGFFYVGMTLYPYQRIKDHFEGFGANFTKKNRPECVLELLPLDSDNRKESYKFEKDKAKKYAKKYGRQRVIGGKFLTLK